MKDQFGNSVAPGDFVVYSRNSSNYHLSLGLVLFDDDDHMTLLAWHHRPDYLGQHKLSRTRLRNIQRLVRYDPTLLPVALLAEFRATALAHYPVTYTREPDGAWVAQFLRLDDCMGFGETQAEARQSLFASYHAVRTMTANA